MVPDAVHDIRNNDLRFNKVIVSTEFFGALLIGFLAESGQHNNFQVGRFRSVSQNIKYIETADFRHHYIKYDKIRFVGTCIGKRFFSVGYAPDIETFGLQAGNVYTGQRVVIFN